MAEFRPSWDQEDFNVTGDTEKRRNPRSMDDRLQRDFQVEENPTGFDVEIRQNLQLLSKINPEWKTKGLTPEQMAEFLAGANEGEGMGEPGGYLKWLESVEGDQVESDLGANPFHGEKKPKGLFPGDRQGQGSE